MDGRSVPLTLVTGPANAAKAGVVLGGYREALQRSFSRRLGGPEPLLVVPTSADVEPYQRELAATGAFGGDVTTFSRLLRLIAQRSGYRARQLGFVARDRVVEATVTSVGLRTLGASAATPGFARAAGRLFGELQRALVPPERFGEAMQRWGFETGRGDYAADVAALYSAYLARLEELGQVDPEGFAWGALDALRAEPSRWGGRPVFLYGFDDLTPAQLDTVETLVRVCGADVTLSLTYEPGRAAFAARAATVEILRPLASAVRELPELDDHYERSARPALHHLERHLFEGAASPAGRVGPNGAVRLLEAGGERAEAELIGAALLELVRDGAAPGDIAVLARDAEQGPLLQQVLESYGLPVERAERVPVARTRLGAGVLAFARAALGGSVGDLLGWLRTPGKVADARVVDELERRARRAEVSSAEDAMRLWGVSPAETVAAGTERTPSPHAFEDRAGSAATQQVLEGVATRLEALREAAAEGTDPLLDVLQDELEAIWTAPHHRQAAVLGAEAHADARVAAEVRHAAQELRRLADADPALTGDAHDVIRTLGAVEVRLGTPRGDGVLLADPLTVRARRFRVVVVCGLQESAFPKRPTAEPFLDDADRRTLAQVSGIVLPLHEDALARERFLFYTAVSRAEEVLFLSFRASDEEGEPQLRSPFVDDVRALFTEELWTGRGRRLLAEVTWPPAQAPTPLELRRAQAAAAGPAQPEPGPLALPGAGAVKTLLAAHDTESARGLETFAACGVRWLVERQLRPRQLEPDPEAMRRGSLAHDVLEKTLSTLKERTGSARLTPETRDAAQAALTSVVDALRASRAGVRARAGLRALEVELARFLDSECANGPGYEPEYLEWRFGGPKDDHGPLQLSGVAVTGRVDRIDVGAAGAVVRDYKASKGYPRASWAADGQLQAALYALAARELLGLDPAGALYQPLRGKDLRPRGGAREGGAAVGMVDNDVMDPGDWEALLDELRDQAQDAAARMRAGEIRPCPSRCTPRGCAYPGICRAPDADVVPT
jgi:ATP-dependent helicase/DNAse subunit B